MKIAFVGIEKDWEDLYNRNYVHKFIKHHLELPWYYSYYGNNDVWIVTNSKKKHSQMFDNGRALRTQTPEDFIKNNTKFDVVIHWRKWIDNCYKPEAINVINSQDHSYSNEWKHNVIVAYGESKLYGILCFPKWHKENLRGELDPVGLESLKLLEGVTLGVDTSIYKPTKKNRRELLWASDPGRGLDGAIELAIKLFQKDDRFRLNICWPDYAADRVTINHPALVYHKNIENGPKLWNLFNTCGFLPYTSTFLEPSSRAHRQAMAAGCVVLYPDNMGTPSDLITNGFDGCVGGTVNDWVTGIERLADNDKTFDLISRNARQLAVDENWQVQAKRFNKLFKGIIEDAKH